MGDFALIVLFRTPTDLILAQRKLILEMTPGQVTENANHVLILVFFLIQETILSR